MKSHHFNKHAPSVLHAFVYRIGVFVLPKSCAHPLPSGGALATLYVGANSASKAVSLAEEKLHALRMLPIYTFESVAIEIDGQHLNAGKLQPATRELRRIKTSQEIWCSPLEWLDEALDFAQI